MLKRIIWHSNPPWMPSGYGQQTALFVPRFKAAGYEMLVSTFAGLAGAPVVWDGITVMPAGQDPYGADVIPAHHYHGQADLVLTLHDVWVIPGDMVYPVPLACWIPVDTDRLSGEDKKFIDAADPILIAMSRHGEKVLKTAGFDPLYVPHAVDTSVFQPRADRDELRERLGVTGKFVIAINAANKDAIRKCFFEQFEAFARFHREVPESVLLVHTLISNANAPDLRPMAADCGISDAVKYSDQYRTLMGLFKPADIAAWLSCADVLSNVAMAEGFGITPLEAMACGVPAVVNESSAMVELSLGPEWRAEEQPFWNPTHLSRWHMPMIDSITERYFAAYETLTDPETGAAVRKQAREKALDYDVNRVMSKYWLPALHEIEENRLPAQLAKKKTAMEKANASGYDGAYPQQRPPRPAEEGPVIIAQPDLT